MVEELLDTEREYVMVRAHAQMHTRTLNMHILTQAYKHKHTKAQEQAHIRTQVHALAQAHARKHKHPHKHLSICSHARLHSGHLIHTMFVCFLIIISHTLGPGGDSHCISESVAERRAHTEARHRRHLLEHRHHLSSESAAAVAIPEQHHLHRTVLC